MSSTHEVKIVIEEDTKFILQKIVENMAKINELLAQNKELLSKTIKGSLEVV